MKPQLLVRAGLLALAILLGIAALLMHSAERRQAEILVLARDVAAGERLVESDLRTRGVVQGDAPPGAIREASAAIGKFARGPLPQGQYLVTGNLDSDAAQALSASSFSPPAEWSLVALPMEFEFALGGALGPGQRVDVYAVRKRSDDPAQILAPGAVVVDIRSNDGLSLALARPPGVDADEPVGSVLVAVPRALLAGIISSIESSNFVLVTSAGGPV